jgi:hypothetical protein
MLSRATMSWFCLGALWLVAVLVAAAAYSELRTLLALAARLRRLSPADTGVGLAEGEIQRALGADLVFASHEIRQIGRALGTKRPACDFRDRSHESRVWGGTVRIGQDLVEIPRESARAEVWTGQRAKRVASACAAASDFRAAYAVSCQPAGWPRTVTTVLREGDRVFVSGEFLREAGHLRVRANGAAGLLIAAADPRIFVRRRLLGASAFIFAELSACALVTRLACVRPAFGPLSTLGACACLLFFLAVTPIGVWLRDWCRSPHEAFLHGRWTEAPSAVRGRAPQRKSPCHSDDSSAPARKQVI